MSGTKNDSELTESHRKRDRSVSTQRSLMSYFLKKTRSNEFQDRSETEHSEVNNEENVSSASTSNDNLAPVDDSYNSAELQNVVDNNVQKNLFFDALDIENRKKLIPIINTIFLCGRQNFPLRGHRDDGDLIQNSVNNEGNFRELLKFRIDSGDDVLKKHLQNCPKNASFISKTTQNDLIDCCASVILHKIVNAVKESKYFSILVDETSDISSSEQLVLCIRYVFHDKVQEDFLKLVIVENASGFNLSKIILHQLDDLGLNIKYLRGQGYDGGANMSGKYQGVQAQILKIQHLALYTHCASHCLNLSISKACSVVLIRNVVGNIQEVITFFRASPKRMLLLKTTLMKVLPNSKSFRLKSVCETRWIERQDAILQFLELYDVIINCLDELVNSNEEITLTSSKANNLLNSMLKFEFLITLQVLAELFSITLPLSKQLQNQNLEYFQS
ncbi:52 kDa repressor of the inhibitor of the protein kinase-like [Myzus persicae]|uniref:52 kDa repressor of the inhibitor of the protein kinase-like n=1 Tax=Myzus persicae TaxID=13164 RepID=UPI000B936998|nr:52 kDa repressor of the inhibitor of the protein kinase-like [Myzus persicae]